ncbi:MAG: signal peptidase I [Clostridiales bacterium]|nr:signal peptidase I [Clostridiales bacterium]
MLAAEMNRADELDEEEEKKRSSRLDVYDWIQSIVSTLIIVILAFIFIGRQIGVDGTSMRDTLHDADSVFVTGLFYTPHYGDIIIIKVDAYNDKPLVKRVIANEGQTIDINFDTSEVIVDGKVLYEPYIKEPTRVSLDFSGEVTVPEGCVFVMGDNRNASRDSRDMEIGFIDVRNVIGKVHFILFPGGTKADSAVTAPRDWSRIGSVYKTLP